MIGGLESTSLKKKKKKIVSRTVQVPFRVVHSGSLQSIPVVDICRADQKKNQRKKMLRGLATYSKDRENEVDNIFILSVALKRRGRSQFKEIFFK